MDMNEFAHFWAAQDEFSIQKQNHNFEKAMYHLKTSYLQGIISRSEFYPEYENLSSQMTVLNRCLKYKGI